MIFRNKVGSYVGGFTRKISHVTKVLVARDGVGLGLQRSWQQIILDVMHYRWSKLLEVCIRYRFLD